MNKLSILQFINVRWLNAEAGYGLTLSKKLHERGHRVFVCGVENTPPVNTARDMGLNTFTSLKLHHYNPFYLFKDLNILIDFIKEENIKVINTHRSEGHFLGALAKKTFKNKLVLIRTRGDVRFPKNYFFNRWLYNYTDKIITSSYMMEKTYFAKLHVPQEKIVTIYNAVDIKRFDPCIDGTEIRNKYGIRENEILVGIVGRLSPVKGHKYFIDAASIILKQRPDIKFIVSGKESQIKFVDLKAQAEQLNIEKQIIFSGVEKDVTQLMAAIDIGVVASLGSETNCRVTQEFMAMERPLVGTNVGVIPEVLLNGECGKIVPPGDSQSIAGAILDLINNTKYSALLGKNARKRMVDNFNEDLFVEKTEEIYFKCISESIGEL